MPEQNKLVRISLEAATEALARIEERYVHQEKGFVDKGIEPNIRPVVIALMAHGFPTQNSCEGHLGSNIYPWVRFEPRGTSDTLSSVLQHLERIHWEVEQLEELAGAFWGTDPGVSRDRELKVFPSWDPSVPSDEVVAERALKDRAKGSALPGYWLRCYGADILSQLPGELLQPHREDILLHRQQDMLAFGEFLVSKL